MDKSDVAAQLRELANGSEHRKEIAKLRSVFDDVEAAIAAGVKRQAILEVLCKQGLRMDRKTFDMQIYRIRQSRKKAAPEPDTAGEPGKAELPGTDETAVQHDAASVQAPAIEAGNALRIDIEKSKEKARRYISGPFDLDVDKLLNKGNE